MACDDNEKPCCSTSEEINISGSCSDQPSMSTGRHSVDAVGMGQSDDSAGAAINFNAIRALLSEAGISWDGGEGGGGPSTSHSGQLPKSREAESMAATPSADARDADAAAVDPEPPVRRSQTQSQESMDDMERVLGTTALADRKREYLQLLNKIKDFDDHGDVKEAKEMLKMVHNRQHELYAHGLTTELVKYDAEIISRCYHLIDRSLRVQCGLDGNAFSLQRFASSVRRCVGRPPTCEDDACGPVTVQELAQLRAATEPGLYRVDEDVCRQLQLQEEDGDDGGGGTARHPPLPPHLNFVSDILTVPPLNILPTMSFLRYEANVEAADSPQTPKKKPKPPIDCTTRGELITIGTTTTDGESKEELEMKQKMKAALVKLSNRGSKPVPLYQITLDKMYLSNTARNFLILSFLIQEGFAGVEGSRSDSSAQVYINLDASDGGKEEFRGCFPTHEMIVPVTYRLHTHMILECERLGIAPVLYHGKPALGAATDWGAYRGSEQATWDAFLETARLNAA